MAVHSGEDIAAKVFHSCALSVRDKHHAMQEIIDKMPDESLFLKDYDHEHHKVVGLHALLREYINEQSQMEKQFFADESEVVYLAELRQRETGEYTQIREPSLCWNDCGQKITEYQECEMVSGRFFAVVTKFYPKQYVNGFMKELTAEFDENGTLMDISSQMMMTFPRFRNAVFKMEQLMTNE